MRLRDRSDAERTVVVGALCEVAALGLAWALVPLRDVLPVQTVAIALLGIVVAAAVFGGRAPAVGAALVAGLALNYFHTRPYGRLKIDDAGDRITFVVVILGGLAVAQLVGHGRQKPRHGSELEDQARLTELARASEGLPLAVTVRRALDEIQECLGAHDVWIEAAGSSSASATLPVLDERAVRDMVEPRRRSGGTALPKDGVQIPVGPTDASPRVVVRTDARSTVPLRARRHAVAVATLIGQAFSAQPSDPMVRRLGYDGGATR